MARLKEEQEQRTYANLISKHTKPDTLSFSTNTTNNGETSTDEEDGISPSLVLNILLSVVMCAVAVFVMTRWWSNDGLRVLVSLGTAIVVGIAEVGVYAIYLHKLRSGRQRERTKKETKVVLGEYTGGKEATDGTGRLVALDAGGDEWSTTTTKEEIWGKGVNGGMRRRVRDKWEKEQEQERQKENNKPSIK